MADESTVRAQISSGELVQLPVTPRLKTGARFALITLTGRTEPPVMAEFRRFVRERFASLQPVPPSEDD